MEAALIAAETEAPSFRRWSPNDPDWGKPSVFAETWPDPPSDSSRPTWPDHLRLDLGPPGRHRQKSPAAKWKTEPPGRRQKTPADANINQLNITEQIQQNEIHVETTATPGGTPPTGMEQPKPPEEQQLPETRLQRDGNRDSGTQATAKVAQTSAQASGTTPIRKLFPPPPPPYSSFHPVHGTKPCPRTVHELLAAPEDPTPMEPLVLPPPVTNQCSIPSCSARHKCFECFFAQFHG